MVVSLSVQLFSEGKLYSSTSLIYFTALHIETSLVDGTYEYIQEPDGVFTKAWTNIELTEAPNSDSEEPKTTDSLDFNTGKPRSIILLFQIMQLIVIIYLCI